MPIISITAQPTLRRDVAAIQLLHLVADAAIRPILSVWRAWRRWRTERIIAALPTEILKDIGYPSVGDM